MTTPIPCDDDNCNLPVGHVVDDVLIIESRHHGKRHRRTISLHYLRKLLTECDKLDILRTDGVKQQAPP